MRYAAALLVCFIVAGCGPEPEPPPPAGFIALERDFIGYDTWEVKAFEGEFVDEAHTAGPRKVFLNKRAPSGSTEWPVGTIFVKELDFTTFAMVKRGNGYNENGAKGWEWFELTRDANDVSRIKWRGLGPPLGENYSKSGQTCNACHGGAVANDSVLTVDFHF
ncbi:MAG: hypothetical protein DI536_22535 [Archangium gephyra]|uniref:Cytochrome P460 domain-containing protein n=1 Tax=Archangium gephyra TaxID=48 RepID=A0A2W5VGC8_9BACT|nr:MAG: hypothetical protein DI536_22535 [Archangium gephyra]